MNRAYFFDQARTLPVYHTLVMQPGGYQAYWPCLELQYEAALTLIQELQFEREKVVFKLGTWEYRVFGFVLPRSSHNRTVEFYMQPRRTS